MSDLESVGTGELISEMMEIFNEVQNRPLDEFDEEDIQRLVNLQNGMGTIIIAWLIWKAQKKKEDKRVE